MTWSSILTVLMVLLFLIACLLLILTVLIQKPQGGGLAGAFGSGAGSGQTAFGTRTGDALTVATIIMFVFYLATAIGLTYLIRPPGPVPPPAASAQPGTEPAEGTTGGAAAPTDTGNATTPPAAPAGEQSPASQPATNPPAENPTTPRAAPATAEPAPAAPPATPEQPK